jgi:choline transport protein
MVSASIIFIVGSYVIPQGILAWRGRDKLLPDRAFDLGRWGFTVNTVSAVWTFFLIILCCLPTHYPVKKENMNYNRYVYDLSVVVFLFEVLIVISIVATFLLLLTWLGWVYSRRGVFEGPVVDKKLLIETRKQQLGKNTNGPNDRTPLL